MASVMIAIDPHKASHTAVAIGGSEEPPGELRVRARGARAERLLAWAAAPQPRSASGEGMQPARPVHTPATGSSGKPLPGLATTP